MRCRSFSYRKGIRDGEKLLLLDLDICGESINKNKKRLNIREELKKSKTT